MPYRKGKGEIAEGLEWKTAEWTGEEGGGDDRKSFSYFGYRFAGMPVRLVARFGIPRRQFCGRVQATRCSRGCHARIAANRFLSLPSLSFFVLIKLGGEKNISVHPPFLEGDFDSSFELFVIRFG